MIHMVDFLPFFHRETASVAYCLLSCEPDCLEKGFTLKCQHLLPGSRGLTREANKFRTLVSIQVCPFSLVTFSKGFREERVLNIQLCYSHTKIYPLCLKDELESGHFLYNPYIMAWIHYFLGLSI